MTRRVAIGYARVSVGDDSSLSLEAQEVKLRAHAAASGLFLTGVVTDPGVSAGVPLGERPGGSALVRQLRHPDAEGVVLLAVRMDRLFRSAVESLTWLDEWQAAGIHPVLLDLGLDMTTPSGRLIFTVLAAVAEMERTLIRTRTKDALGALRARGGYGTHEAPLGWRAKLPDGRLVTHGQPDAGAVLVEDEHEQAAIGRMLELDALGKSDWSMANRYLPEEGYKPRQTRWWRSTVKRVLLAVRNDPAAVARATAALRRHREREAALLADRERFPTPEDKRAAALESAHARPRRPLSGSVQKNLESPLTPTSDNP